MTDHKPHVPSPETAESCFLDGAAGEFLPGDWHAFLAQVKRDAVLSLADDFNADALEQSRQGNEDGADFYRIVAAEIEKRIPEETP